GRRPNEADRAGRFPDQTKPIAPAGAASDAPGTKRSQRRRVLICGRGPASLPGASPPGGPSEPIAMPANLPPQYLKAEEEFRRATAPAERLDKLRELFRLLPKHKGTEKLQSELKQKISRAKEELDASKHAAKKGGISHRVPREGAGQVVLVGPPN